MADGLAVAAAKPRRVPERRIVRRSRLLAVLDAVDAQTILLIAPAGYGKTTLSRQWIDQAGGAWVTVTGASGDIAVLARDLAAALVEVADFDSQRVEAAISAGRTPEEKAHAVSRVVLAQIKEPIAGWIVLDDYHLLLGSPVAEELIGTLQRSGRFRFVVASRERPTWATARRRVYGETVEFGSAELALDDDEAAELLPEKAHPSALRAQARGWPAALGLAAYSRPEVLRSSEALAASLYEYLAEDLFSGVSAPVQHALTSLAALPPVTREELVVFLGNPDGVEGAIATGLAYEEAGRIEVHPLARGFLAEKLRARADADGVARAGLDLAIDKGLYDHAFDLLVQLDLIDRLEDLVIAAYPSLLAASRTATLDRFREFGVATCALSSPIIDLLAGQASYHRAELGRALALAESSVARLEEAHPLKVEAYLAAGRAAHLSYQDALASSFFDEARKRAKNSAENYLATHGWCLSQLQQEGRVDDAMRKIEEMPASRPADRIALALARTQHAFLGRRGRLDCDGDQVEEAASVAASPALSTAWSYMQAVARIFQARYSEAEALARSTLTELDTYGMSYGVPHAEWALAAAELGLRRFARCDARLRKIEQLPGHGADPHMQLNVWALRSRLLLSQGRIREATEVSAAEAPAGAGRAMNGEYLATRAVALAVLGRDKEALDAVGQATDFTAFIDTRVLSQAAAVVVAVRRVASETSSMEELLTLASTLGVWDGVVCGLRASPELRLAVTRISHHRAELGDVLIRSNDAALARSCGLINRVTGSRGRLSRREREIMDHVRQGQTNAQIAASLFIARGTVKSHMDHIFDKLGARTRAEAVARYAEIEKAETDESDPS